MPNRGSETNRFQGLSLTDLYEACHTRASSLQRLGEGFATLTPAERDNLARDTALLLLAVAPTLASGEYVPGTPTKAILEGSEDFLPAFLTAYEAHLREFRYRTLVTASDLAYGGRADRWRQEGTIDGQPVYDLAIGSEEGLALVLAHLEQAYKDAKTKL